MADDKRRLPIVSSPRPEPDSGADEDPPRPPWHWVGFGVVAIFGVWLPLAWISARVVRGYLERRLPGASSPEEISAAFATMSSSERASIVSTLAVPHVLALALASFVGGYLVGRYGVGTTRREPALAGLFAGIVACALTFGAVGGFSLAPLVVPLVSAPTAYLGGSVGRRRRSA